MMRRHPVSRYLLRLAPILLIGAVAACGPFRRGAGQPPATIVFANESLTQADVFVVGQGVGTRRIGTVMAGRTDTLVVPGVLTGRGTVNIVARLFGRSRAPRTGPVSIFSGEQYQVRLPPDARLLSFLPSRS
jgi:hypothetical protein